MKDERRINVRVSESDFLRLDDKRHAMRTSWQSLLGGYLQEWLHGDAVTPPSVDDRTREEEEAAAALVAWLRDPDPKEKVNREVLLMALRSYRERHPEIREEAVELRTAGRNLPNPAAEEGGPSRDGQTDTVPAERRRSHNRR